MVGEFKCLVVGKKALPPWKDSNGVERQKRIVNLAQNDGADIKEMPITDINLYNSLERFKEYILTIEYRENYAKTGESPTILAAKEIK